MRIFAPNRLSNAEENSRRYLSPMLSDATSPQHWMHRYTSRRMVVSTVAPPPPTIFRGVFAARIIPRNEPPLWLRHPARTPGNGWQPELGHHTIGFERIVSSRAMSIERPGFLANRAPRGFCRLAAARSVSILPRNKRSLTDISRWADLRSIAMSGNSGK